MEEDRLLKVSEVIRRLGLSRSAVWDLIARGELASLTIGRARRVRLSALEQFIERRTADGRMPSPAKAEEQAASNG